MDDKLIVEIATAKLTHGCLPEHMEFNAKDYQEPRVHNSVYDWPPTKPTQFGALGVYGHWYCTHCDGYSNVTLFTQESEETRIYMWRRLHAKR